MDKEYSLEYAFWGFLKNRGVNASEIEKCKELLPPMLARTGYAFHGLLRNCDVLENYEPSEKLLVDHLNTYYESMLRVSPYCEVDLSNITETELNTLIRLFEESEVDVFVGFMAGIEQDTRNYSTEDQIYICTIFVHDRSYVPIAFAKLLKKSNIMSEVKVHACADNKAFEMFLAYKDAKLIMNEQKTYFDNLESLEMLEKKFEEQGVTVFLDGLDDPKDSCVIARVYPEVLKQFANPEITGLMYWLAKGRGEDTLEYLEPKSFEDLMFLWTIAYSSNTREQMIELAETYSARRDGKQKLPASLPKELKRTYGFWVYDTQEAAAKKAGVECPFDKPAFEMIAKLMANVMYKFAYLCAKYGIHKKMV